MSNAWNNRIPLIHRVKNKVKTTIASSWRPPAIRPTAHDWNTKFDTLLDAPGVELYYWPAYSNPYQALFYGAETDHFKHKPGSIEDALATLRAGQRAQVCFHLHWLRILFAGPDIEEKIATFTTHLRHFCDKGGTLIWTIHNLAEHDRQEGHLEAQARREIASLATAIFVHGDAARAAVEALLPEAKGKCEVIAHGNYIGVYPDTISPANARATLKISAHDTVFANVGLVRKYKGLNHLCDALQNIETAKLIVAGVVPEDDKDDIKTIFAQHPQARLYDAWVQDEDLQLYHNAADFIVLPYITTLTSGAAILALSFAVPIIAPKLGPFPELVEDGKTGFCYDPSSKDSLNDTFQKAANMTAREKAEMRVAAYEAACRFTWSSGRAKLFQILSDTGQKAVKD